jgi:hypothetical protein
MALLFVLGTQSQAAFIEWTYEVSREPVEGAVGADSGGTGGVSLTNELEKTAVGSSDVVATNLRVFSSADPSAPDTITNGAYSLTITIKDVASGEAGSLTFTGLLNGWFSTSSANIENEFTGITSDFLVLGDNTYEVTIGPYSPPGPPSATNAGSIGAHVEVTPGGVVSETPEPGTLALAGFGLALTGVARWRRRRPA